MTITLNGTTGIVSPKVNALDLELDSKNVVERGSNANGEYVRFADGTQICTMSRLQTSAINNAYGSLYQDTTLWDFPAQFIDPPSVSCGLGKWGTGASWSGLGASPSVSSASLRVWDAVSRGSGELSLSATAIGRWY